MDPQAIRPFRKEESLSLGLPELPSLRAAVSWAATASPLAASSFVIAARGTCRATAASTWAATSSVTGPSLAAASAWATTRGTCQAATTSTFAACLVASSFAIAARD